MIRTAAALGARSVIALPGTADVWNAKVVRSAAGGHFHLHVLHAELDELLAALRHAAVPLWGADAGGRAVNEVTGPPSLALAMGNEGAGLTPDVRGAVTELVALPMTPGVESLNVSVAAGILLFALRR
jgi:TrmH family RNA methyltransferase